jgi:hypothetical protein
MPRAKKSKKTEAVAVQSRLHTEMQQLVGGTITLAEAQPSPDFDGSELPVLAVAMPDGTEFIVWIVSDPEGNSVGFPQINKFDPVAAISSAE